MEAKSSMSRVKNLAIFKNKRKEAQFVGQRYEGISVKALNVWKFKEGWILLSKHSPMSFYAEDGRSDEEKIWSSTLSIKNYKRIETVFTKILSFLF